jgi:phage minor structural protein
MIILYDTTETKFTSNGLGVLDHDIINPIIEESANGTFKLSFDYPLSGICGNRIGRRMYVKADDPDVEGNIFKIYNLEKSDGILSVVAFQVANEFNNNWIEHTNIMGKNGQSALDQMKSNLTNSTRFNFYSDIDSTANSEVVRLNPLTWLIDSSTDNSFVNRWGGEIKRDGFNIRMFKQRGSDNGVQIRWRKNLSSYNVKWDDTTVVTRIRPVGYNGLTLPEIYVDSPKLANYGDPIVKEVKYDDIKVSDGNSSSDDNAYKTVDEAYTALRNAAAKEFSESHLDDPTVTADVSMISLKNTREYADVAELETIKPWDTIQLINERDNVDIQMRLNSYKYNPLNHEFTELKFVSVNQSLTSGNTSLSSVINGISSTVQSVSNVANQAQIAANGKNAINRGAEDPNHLTFNGTLTDGDIYYRQNGDKKEMWIYSAKDKAWKLEVGDMTAQEIADEVAQGKKDADQMRKDTEARFEKAEESLASISDDMSKTENDLKSVDAKFGSKTDTLNQSITQAKSDISDQVDQLKTVKSTADSALKKANGNDSSITDINQNIDKINGKFDLTATKTDIDSVNKKYTQQQAQIDANTKGITLKASQDSVNTLSQTVTSNSSSLSVLSNEVKQKTSKTDFDTLTGRVTNAEQKIDATAEGVTSTVSKVATLQTQVNNSAVGTNLLKRTQDWNASDWEYSSTSHSLGGDVLTVDATSSNSSIDVTQFVNGISPLTQYTLGWNLQFQSSADKRLTLYVVEYKDKNNVTSNYQDHNFPLVASYNTTDRRSMTFTTQSDCTAVKVFVRTQAGTKNSIRRMKLEKGSVATDWSANPADNATVTALNVVKQTADETYEGLFNKDGTNKIDVTAQGLKAQIESAKESAQGYAKTTIDAKAGEFNASLSSVQTTLQNDATNKANNAKNYANDKVNNLAIGGTNLIPLGNIVAASSTQIAYDSTNDIRTLTIANGAGGSWGGGLQNNAATKHEIPWGQSYTYSVEIKPSVDGLIWNSDTNTYPYGVSAWGGNDNDNVSLRTSNSSMGGGTGTKLIPNVWNKVWVTLINSDSRNSNKVSIYDNSTVCVVNNTGSTVTVKFRHFKGEIGNKATDWRPAPEDVQNDAQSRADNALNNAKSYANSKATALQTDYDNKISNTSKEFTEKWTAVTKRVQDSVVGANLLVGTSPNTVTIASSSSKQIGTTTIDDWNSNIRGQTITISVDVTWSNFASSSSLPNRLGWEISTILEDGTKGYYGAWVYPTTASGSQRITSTFNVANKKITSINYQAAYNETAGSASFSKLKLESGSNATPWCPNFNELATQSYAETLVDVKAGSITTDLKSYTDAAKTSAVNTASSDATNKANDALNNAKSYADNVTKDTATEFSKKLTTATQQINSLGQVNLVPNGGFLTGMTGWTQVGSGGFYYSDADSDTVQGHHSLVGQITDKTSDTWYGCASPRFAVRAKQSLSARADIKLWQAISGIVQLQIEWFTDGVAGTKVRSGFYATKCGRYTGGGFKTFKDENFTVPDGTNAARAVIYFQRNAKASTTRIMVTPATTIGEYVDNFVDYTQAQTLIDATAGTLQAKVSGADYHNLISMNGNGILLDAHGVNNSNKSIILSGDHVKIDSSNPVVIPNAAISSLDAGKIRGGMLNFADVNGINFNADNITAGTLTGVAFHQSNSGHDTWIDGNGIHDYDNHGNNTWIQKGNIQVYDNAGQGMFMQGGKLVLSNLDVWGTIASMSSGAKPPVDDYGVIEHGVGMGLGGIKIHGGGGSALLTDNTGKQAGVIDTGYYGIVNGGGVSASWHLAMLGGDQDWCAAIKAGKNYGNFIADQPSILVGTADWPSYTGSTSTPGQNVVVQANGIWLYSIGETVINANKLTINAGIHTTQGLQVDGEWTQVKSLHVLNSFVNSSLLSRKTNISKLNTKTVRDEIRKAEIYRYQYKDEVKNGSSSYHDSVIIDDVNEVSQYYVPDDWVSNDRKGRDDGNALGYAIVALQDLYQQNDELKTQLDTMQNEISELKKIIKQK